MRLHGPENRLAAALVALGAGLGLLLALLGPKPGPASNLEWISSAPELPAFELQGSEGIFSRESLEQGWHLIVLGYTRCPDVCPANLSALRQLYELAPQLPVRTVFVSIDPGWDKPAELAAYARWFHPGFLAVTGNSTALANLARGLGTGFRNPGDDPGAIAHGTALSLVGPGARLRARLRPGFDVEQLARELRAGVTVP